MRKFREWLEWRSLLESKTSSGRELLKMCADARWVDDDGTEGVFLGWEQGTKENKLRIRNPIVGEVVVVISRRTAILPHQLLATAQSKYRSRVRQIKELQASRKAV